MNQEIDINSIVKIEQMPKVFYQLELIGKEVETRLQDIDELNCTEENKQEVKKRKQEITAFKNLMEDKRKEIKKKLLEDYEVFNTKYEVEVKGKLLSAESILNDKINLIEVEQKKQKENNLREFAEEYFEKYNIKDIVTFESIKLNITLSVSEKSLKEQVVDFCERVSNDVDAILLEDEQLRNEILAEYKKNLDYALSKRIVIERHKELQRIKQQQEEIQKKKEEELKIQEAIVEVIEEPIIIAPAEIEKPDARTLNEYEITFTITDTMEKIKLLKQFLIENNIKYREED